MPKAKEPTTAMMAAADDWLRKPANLTPQFEKLTKTQLVSMLRNYEHMRAITRERVAALESDNKGRAITDLTNQLSEALHKLNNSAKKVTQLETKLENLQRDVKDANRRLADEVRNHGYTVRHKEHALKRVDEMNIQVRTLHQAIQSCITASQRCVVGDAMLKAEERRDG